MGSDTRRALAAAISALGTIFSAASAGSRVAAIGWLALAAVILSALFISGLRRMRQTPAGS